MYDILDKTAEETAAEDVETVQKRFEETGSFEYARQRMHSHAEAVLAALESLHDSPSASGCSHWGATVPTGTTSPHTLIDDCQRLGSVVYRDPRRIPSG